jgi:hypothetical protein
MRTVFAIASGHDPKTAAICSAVFRKNWSPWYFSRFSSLTLLPVPMHSSTSCGC